MTSSQAPLPRQPRVDRLVQPLQQFIATEASGGIVLMAAALFALVWANSPWSEEYFDLLETHLVLDLDFYVIDESLHFWINDGLMVLFFFLVGLEIKRELVLGELSSMRRAVVPFAAALGGMLAPVAIFFLFARGDATDGWGVPMATDIAFALGVAALLGSRVPVGLKIMLLALAIFDDLGAVGVIAIFYSESIEVGPSLLALALLVVVFLCGRIGIRQVPFYVLLGLVTWGVVVKSGVHPTVVGVALGLLTPTWSHYPRERFVDEARGMVESYEQGLRSYSEEVSRSHRTEALLRLRALSDRTIAPLDRLEHQINQWVAFLIVPVFALANAGVDLRGDALSTAFTGGLTWGIALGLFFGKPLGIVLGTWVAVRLGAELSPGATWAGVLGVGAVAGIGFTVALFVAELAYTDPQLLVDAKVGIFAGSVVSGLVGYLLLRRLHTQSEPSTSEIPSPVPGEG